MSTPTFQNKTPTYHLDLSKIEPNPFANLSPEKIKECQERTRKLVEEVIIRNLLHPPPILWGEFPFKYKQETSPDTRDVEVKIIQPKRLTYEDSSQQNNGDV